jgi:hypothetical protein
MPLETTRATGFVAQHWFKFHVSSPFQISPHTGGG